MIEIDVTAGKMNFNFGAIGADEVVQNVRMIMATTAFSCPLNRDFAWSPDLDAPLPVAKARITASIMQAIKQFEPRAQVVRVVVEEDPQNGILKPVVRVRIDDTIQPD